MTEMKDSGVEWIGEIPKSKYILRNKYMFSYEKGKLPFSTNLDKKGFAYIGASDLDSGNNEYKIYTEDETLPDAEYNDLLILWDGARAGLCGTHKTGKISSTIVKVKADKNVYEPFLYWYYKGFENFMYQSVNGTTIPHMNRKYIEDICFIDWTIEEQQRISAYLDTKCTKIDTITEKQQKIIEKLKAYKLSLITETVTKGFNPDVRLKDSGIEWIGKIPEHWKISRVGLFYEIMLGKMVQPNSKGNDTLEKYLCAINVGGNKLSFNVIKEMWFNDFEKQQYLLKKGDLLVVEGGDVASSAIIDFDIENVYYQNALHRVRSKKGLNEFLRYWLMATKGCRYFDMICNKATIAHFTKDKFMFLPFVVLSIEEQKKICDYLDKKCSAIDSAIEKKQAIIEKLKEYKKSLIYEVVTGKKEIIKNI